MRELKINMEQYLSIYFIIVGAFITLFISFFIERKGFKYDIGFNSIQLLILGLAFCLGFLITILFIEGDE